MALSSFWKLKLWLVDLVISVGDIKVPPIMGGNYFTIGVLCVILVIVGYINIEGRLLDLNVDNDL